MTSVLESKEAMVSILGRLGHPLAWLGVLLSSLLFAELTEEVVSAGGFSWDVRVPRFVHHYDTPSLDAVMRAFSAIGGIWGVISLAGVVVLALLARGRRADALFVALAIAGASALNALLKVSVHRLRPDLWPSPVRVEGFSYPSGHAASSMAILAALAALFWRTRWRWLTLLLGVPLVGVIGLSRVYLGVHYPSDVLAGWCLALAWVAVLELVGARELDRRAASGAPLLRRMVLAPLYRLYTDRLRREVRRRPLPKHVAVILDGNRRWASRVGLTEPGAGHRKGADKIDELISWCSGLGIEEVTVWALSGENLVRASAQLEPLFEVVAEKLEALAGIARDPRRPLRIRVFGRLEQLPTRLREAAAQAEAASADSGLKLSVAVAYSGRDELVDACRKLVGDLVAAGVATESMAEQVTRAALAARLYTAGHTDPDLIIRTSGELRLSGFLPWQSAHSELYFADVYWPAFRELDFLRALRTFQQRQRRYGL